MGLDGLSALAPRSLIERTEAPAHAPFGSRPGVAAGPRPCLIGFETLSLCAGQADAASPCACVATAAVLLLRLQTWQGAPLQLLVPKTSATVISEVVIENLVRDQVSDGGAKGAREGGRGGEGGREGGREEWTDSRGE